MENTPTTYQRTRRAARLQSDSGQQSAPVQQEGEVTAYVNAAPIAQAVPNPHAAPVSQPASSQLPHSPAASQIHAAQTVSAQSPYRTQPLLSRQQAYYPQPSMPSYRQTSVQPQPSACRAASPLQEGTPRTVAASARPQAEPMTKRNPQRDPQTSDLPRSGSVSRREQNGKSSRPSHGAFTPNATTATEIIERPSKKLPRWLTTALSLSLILTMALLVACIFMQNTLQEQEKKRQQAYRSLLTNYHLTEQADGTLRVTWQDLIEKYAGIYNLDPAFVTAIIRNESSFRTNAVSSVGARGLMQMMPKTAEWIADLLNEPYDFDRIFDAETSIRYGCWYLNYLSEEFQGDPVLVCAAYHAGQGDVKRWLLRPEVSPDGTTVPIENIPIDNTRIYAGRVTQAYGIYQSLLYPQTAPAGDESPDSSRSAVPGSSAGR